MAPFLERGDWAVLQKVPNYVVGDVLVFRHGSEVLVHRSVLKQDGGFRTKGDANPFDDGFLVAPADILGKVVFRIPLLGRLALGLDGR